MNTYHYASVLDDPLDWIDQINIRYALMSNTQSVCRVHTN